MCDPAGERLLKPIFLPRHGTSFRQILVWSATCLFRIQTPLAVGLAFFWAINATQTDTFGALLCRTSSVSPSRTETTGPVKEVA